MTIPKFSIGTEFMTSGKFPRLANVTDILTTTNLAGEIVKIRYVATHVFNNQIVTDSDVLETSIAMRFVR